MHRNELKARLRYPVPHPDDTRAHLKMAYELAREIIEQARTAEGATRPSCSDAARTGISTCIPRHA